MSAPHCHADGSGFTTPLTACVFRWGAGAQQGRYHAYLTGFNASCTEFGYSLQCVVDDFGNLVAIDGMCAGRELAS